MVENSAEPRIAIAALTEAEPSPESEPAKATMQTNSGAGLGTPMNRRSTRMAASAVAAASAGPAIARKSNRMAFLVAHND